MIYFDENKQAYGYKIENAFCIIKEEIWSKFSTLQLGIDYDVNSSGIVDLRKTPEYIAEKLTLAKNNKLTENTQKAKLAIENGYVTFKNAQFETNAQTVGDLTAAMLMLEAQQNPEITHTWLSKDDKAVVLALEDFITLGNLIAIYKNNIWSEKYIAFKTAIENAQTIEELERMEINYE